MKTALHLLNSEFDLTAVGRATIFVSLFAHQLPQDKLNPGDICNSLASQWRSRNDERSQGRWEQWQAVCSPKCTAGEGELRKALMLRIEDIVQRHGQFPSEDPLSGPRTTASGITIPSSSYGKVSQSQALVLIDDDHGLGPSRKRPKTSTKTTLLSDLQPQGNVDTDTVTSPRHTGANRQPNRLGLPKTPYPRPDDKFRDGKVLLLTEKEHEDTGMDLKPVDEKEAHPRLAPLCYRWVEVFEPRLPC